MSSFFNSPPETEQGKGRIADRACSVFEFGLFRDKDERTTCREGFPRKLESQTEDREGLNALDMSQRFLNRYQSVKDKK
jgi:hypothetical protein